MDVIPHLEDLWRYGRVLTGNDSDADDLVQEALARALSMAGTYDSSRPLLPWLIRIVRNSFFTGSSRVSAEKRRLASFAYLRCKLAAFAGAFCRTVEREKGSCTDAY
ncbi:sigma factor [Mesorhizobium captivum]|uniref:sigma factor n=1 Tax=Mesorhizobium captivum TaxID=3072319 RepID=UPI002A249B85|nr:sigma factor [Mesorhizobium sp. VK3C]MDX8450320.1 sigma factor [Mesorhizobium sp. VK3C]